MKLNKVNRLIYKNSTIDVFIRLGALPTLRLPHIYIGEFHLIYYSDYAIKGNTTGYSCAAFCRSYIFSDDKRIPKQHQFNQKCTLQNSASYFFVILPIQMLLLSRLLPPFVSPSHVMLYLYPMNPPSFFTLSY